MCKVENCSKDEHARGYCGKHLSRVKRHGNPHTVKEPKSLPEGVAARNQVISKYRTGARARELDWDLTKEQCKELFQGNCHYCGKEPSRIYEVERLNGPYTYSGIDRVDNDKGYTPDNTVSCCWECNELKGTLSRDEFVRRCRSVSAFQSCPTPL